ncbi:DUF3626 domain-containing protein [Couchioplanes caeruleus]|uniref:DUF3626 domain-containing protein n=1 Tax=Couchioplanes caeruleus TaxID=56438 RepID=UPI0020BF9DE2|nr:DUF3626 domain-containing protein [Couchioplanes caeruleus]UQU61558.1 DUF3626 domain-containing protein [Couchioplanes caeruleus]
MTPRAARAVAHVRALGAAGRLPVPAARITINFHPDRLLGDGRTVAEHLAAEGVYRSQFETRISNGGLTAYPGGDRDRWEQRMFAGAYPSELSAGRPVYGALNLAGHPDGAAPRFGSCHLRLRAPVSGRATFSHGDSVTEPEIVGTADAFGGIWAALLEQVERTGQALGVNAAAAPEWIAALTAPRDQPGRTLDDYVEAQVHGGVDLSTDVEAVVCDPAFAGTPTAAHLAAIAPLQWHPGFVLDAGEFGAQLRGPDAGRLARALGPGLIDAAVIGAASHRTGDFAEFGDHATVLQLLKYLWHILVIRGHARRG